MKVSKSIALGVAFSLLADPTIIACASEATPLPVSNGRAVAVPPFSQEALTPALLWLLGSYGAVVKAGVITDAYPALSQASAVPLVFRIRSLVAPRGIVSRLGYKIGHYQRKFSRQGKGLSGPRKTQTPLSEDPDYTRYKRAFLLRLGGTIEMMGRYGRRHDPLAIKALLSGFKNYLSEDPEDMVAPFPSMPDSSNLGPKEWDIILAALKRMKETKSELRERLKAKGIDPGPAGGIVVMMGTDTVDQVGLLAALEEESRDCKVVFTGALNPPSEDLETARANLSLALESALDSTLPPDLYFAFHERLHLASRIYKLVASRPRNGFHATHRREGADFESYGLPIAHRQRDYLKIYPWVRVSYYYRKLKRRLKSSSSVRLATPSGSLSMAEVEHLVFGNTTPVEVLEDATRRLLSVRDQGRRPALILQGRFSSNADLAKIGPLIRYLTDNEIPVFSGSKESCMTVGSDSGLFWLRPYQTYAKMGTKLAWLLARGVLFKDLNREMRRDYAGETAIRPLPTSYIYPDMAINDFRRGQEVIMGSSRMGLRALNAALHRLRHSTSARRRLVIYGVGDGGHVSVGDKSLEERVLAWFRKTYPRWADRLPGEIARQRMASPDESPLVLTERALSNVLQRMSEKTWEGFLTAYELERPELIAKDLVTGALRENGNLAAEPAKIVDVLRREYNLPLSDFDPSRKPRKRLLNSLESHIAYDLSDEEWTAFLRRYRPEYLARRMIKDALMGSHSILRLLGEAVDSNVAVSVRTRMFGARTDTRVYEVGAMLLAVGVRSDAVREAWPSPFKPQPRRGSKLVVSKELNRRDVEADERVSTAIRSIIHGQCPAVDPITNLGTIGVYCEFIAEDAKECGLSTEMAREAWQFRNGLMAEPTEELSALMREVDDASRRSELTSHATELYLDDFEAIYHRFEQQLNEFQNFETRVRQMAVGPLPKRMVKSLSTVVDIGYQVLGKMQSRIDLAKGRRPDGSYSGSGLVDFLRNRFKHSAGVHIESVLPEDLVLHGNRFSIYNALENLLVNAVKVTRKRLDKEGIAPDIRVQLSYDEGFVRVAISDNGPGIPQALMKMDHITGRLFFFRLNVSKTKDGSGLGTTDAWYAVHDAGGKFEEVRSTPKKGTFFLVKLPAVTEAGSPDVFPGQTEKVRDAEPGRINRWLRKISNRIRTWRLITHSDSAEPGRTRVGLLAALTTGAIAMAGLVGIVTLFNRSPSIASALPLLLLILFSIGVTAGIVVYFLTATLTSLQELMRERFGQRTLSPPEKNDEDVVQRILHQENRIEDTVSRLNKIRDQQRKTYAHKFLMACGTELSREALFPIPSEVKVTADDFGIDMERERLRIGLAFAEWLSNDELAALLVEQYVYLLFYFSGVVDLKKPTSRHIRRGLDRLLRFHLRRADYQPAAARLMRQKLIHMLPQEPAGSEKISSGDRRKLSTSA